MGNQGTKDWGRGDLDFSSLYVDGQAWNDALSNANFLSKVQKCLLDPSFVAALACDQQEEQVKGREIAFNYFLILS